MYKISFLLILPCLVNLFYLHDQIVRQGNSSYVNLESNKVMNPEALNSSFDNEDIAISISQLICREEIQLPLGLPSQADRDIGFASVFLNLENSQEQMRLVVIKNVEIRSTLNDQLQSFNFEQRVIHLNPLEHAVIDIHLSNKIGYVAQGEVSAVVTYEIDGRAHVMRSEAVEVERN